MGMALWFLWVALRQEANSGHKAITAFRENCITQGNDNMLVIQNIYDLLCREIKNSKIFKVTKKFYKMYKTTSSLSSILFMKFKAYYLTCIVLIEKTIFFKVNIFIFQLFARTRQLNFKDCIAFQIIFKLL